MSYTRDEQRRMMLDGAYWAGVFDAEEGNEHNPERFNDDAQRQHYRDGWSDVEMRSAPCHSAR